MKLRIAIGAVGLLLGLFGVFRLLTQIPISNLVVLFVWLAAAVLLHDGVIAPITAAVGWGLERAVPPRARRALAYGLTAAVGVTAIALPEIHRRGSQAPSKALLQQDYTGNLAIALGIVAALALLTYGVSVLRDSALRRSTPRPNTTNVRPSDDQLSSSE